MSARDLYRSFHGRDPRGIREANFRDPRALVYLGDAVEIVYRCNKLNGGGDGKKAEYLHEFSPGTKLFTDEKGKMLFIMGKRLTIKESGINY